MSGLTIRRARSGEYESIDILIAEAYAHDYGERAESSDPMRFSEIRDREFEVWISESATGELLGSVTLRRQSGAALHEDIADGELDLRLLGVSPRARRLGVGAELMRHTAKHAAAAGFEAVVLKTGPNMVGAHRLYETLGFERVPERDGLWIGGEKVFDLYTYVLPLSE